MAAPSPGIPLATDPCMHLNNYWTPASLLQAMEGHDDIATSPCFAMHKAAGALPMRRKMWRPASEQGWQRCKQKTWRRAWMEDQHRLCSRVGLKPTKRLSASLCPGECCCLARCCTKSHTSIATETALPHVPFLHIGGLALSLKGQRVLRCAGAYCVLRLPAARG